MARNSLILFFIFFIEGKAFANSCCGQTPASFPVLSQEQRFSLNASYSFSQSQGRMFNSDEFYIWQNRQRQIESYQVSVASTFGHSHQVYLSSALLNGSYQDATISQKSQHLSDTQLGYTYELFPEYAFSLWRPVVYVSALLNLPTGKSIYDPSNLNEGADVTGTRQWGAGAGLTLRKVYYPLTMTLQLRTVRLFGKQFANVAVSDYYDSSISALANYTTPFYEVVMNTGFLFNHLSKRTINPGGTSQESQVLALLLGLQKPINDEWVVGVQYSDQTLLGPAKNSLLNRSLTVSLNFNYF